MYDNDKMVYEAKNNKKDLISEASVSIMDSGNILDTFEQKNSYINFTKIDKQNKILSGTFSFEVKNKKTGKILKITDGRFDLKMQYYK